MATDSLTPVKEGNSALLVSPAPVRKTASYVLITPVRNEQATIGITIESVVRQTVPPREWIIVSDESTDRTDEIVLEYAAKYPFVRLLRLTDRPHRNFGSVVFATEAGVAALKTKDYQYIGLLDADIRFAENYYEEMLRRFSADPKLGMAGGLVVDCYDGIRRRMGNSLTEIAGAVQLFRRECFETLEGLIAFPEGGWDAITCVQARMNGFTTRTFPEIEVDHLKPRNIGEGKLMKRTWQLGVREYAVGNHPVYQLVKSAYLCFKPPFLIGGILRLAAYGDCCLRGRKRMLSPKIIRFIRQEQMRKLFRLGK